MLVEVGEAAAEAEEEEEEDELTEGSVSPI